MSTNEDVLKLFSLTASIAIPSLAVSPASLKRVTSNPQLSGLFKVQDCTIYVSSAREMGTSTQQITKSL